MNEIQIALQTVSEANTREHWAQKARRAKHQRGQAALACRAVLSPVDPPLVITLTRIAPRALDSDNLARSFKAVRDGVADWLGIDDGDKRLTWEYRQERGAARNYAVRISLRKMEAA